MKKKKIDLTNLNEHDKKAVIQSIDASERFMIIGGIILGLLQYFALFYPNMIWQAIRNGLELNLQIFLPKKLFVMSCELKFYQLSTKFLLIEL